MIKTRSGLVLEAYASGITPIADPSGELGWAEGLGFGTGYPGGDLDGQAIIPRDIIAWWQINGAKRIAFRQGQKIVYEGYVSALDRLLSEAGQSIRLPLIGGWGHILMNRRWRKYWADSRIDEATWYEPTTALNANDETMLQKMTIDRNERIRIIPKAVAFAQYKSHHIRYSAPTSQTVKRITFYYDLQTAAQSWGMGLYNEASASAPWSVSTSGTGSQDITLATPSQHVRFYFYSGAAQTPPSDGTIYGQISNVMVYSETGSINATEIAKDIIGHFTDLNAETSQIKSNTLSLAPFLAEWDENTADMITRALGFGDASANHWAAYLLNSENAQTPDGKPVLGIEQYPALTDYDLVIRLDGENIAGEVKISRDFGNIFNWIIVEYKDETGKLQWITPDDDASLKDQTSIDDYHQRDCPPLKIGTASSAMALAYGQRYLAANKDPQWNVSPINVTGFINKKAGYPIPTAQTRAGMRLKIEDFRQDLSGSGLTMLITSTRYDEESGVCTMSFGKAEMMDLISLMQFGARKTKMNI